MLQLQLRFDKKTGWPVLIERDPPNDPPGQHIGGYVLDGDFGGKVAQIHKDHLITHRPGPDFDVSAADYDKARNMP